MSHTPGPWRVVEAGGFWIVPNVEVAVTLGEPDITIVPVPLDSEENAFLIAEAPNLLAALEGAVDWLRYASWDPAHQPLSWLRNANAAITKIKGEHS